MLPMLRHNAAYGIVAVQALFFALGGIRDNFMEGKTVMPDEEYLQSWWHDTKLGDSENQSPRMTVICNGWGTFIGTIALIKIAVALTGGKTTLAKTLGALFVVTNLWLCKVFLPMNALMEEHWTNKKNNPAMVNKGDVTPFCAMLVIESVCWLVSQGGLVDFGKIKMV